MITKVFVDGEHGTTGLKILEKLQHVQNIEIISLPYAERHNLAARQAASQAADLVVLCLPDQAAKEAAAYIQQHSNARVIDASTAHRTHKDWVYGFPELNLQQSSKIKNARYVSNPGCYATGAIALLRPILDKQIISPQSSIIINAISGYTGGGKQLIQEMQQDNSYHHFSYALNSLHKHIPEIMQHSNLQKLPIFMPSVGYFPQGMGVFIPIRPDQLTKSLDIQQIYEIYKEHYIDSERVKVIHFSESLAMERFYPEESMDEDGLKIYLFSPPKQDYYILAAQLDNLGKGAAGAAVQNLKLMLSID